METGNVQGISVLNPIGDAIKKTRQILFAPFNFEKWLIIGFCAWLAGLGGGGGTGANFHSNYSPDSRGHSHGAEQIGQEIIAFVSPVLPWLIPAAIVLLFIGLAVALLVVWLKSRGQFMFLDCIVHNRGAVSAPWTTYRNEGNSLFGFRFVVWLATFALTLAAVIPMIVIFFTFAHTDFKALLAGPLIGAGLLLVGVLLVWLLYSLVTVLTDDFVVPVMYLRRCGVMAAWKEVYSLLSANAGRFILYLLILFAAGIVLGLMTTMIAVAACCCFCCVSWVFLIPIVGGYLFAVLILPLSVWRRSFAVLFLAQFGAAYDVFAAAPSPVAEGLIEPLDIIEPVEPAGPSAPDTPENPQES